MPEAPSHPPQSNSHEQDGQVLLSVVPQTQTFAISADTLKDNGRALCSGRGHDPGYSRYAGKRRVNEAIHEATT